ncbi:MAG: hypothetical protein JXE06_05595, partial [Coriobacteriia bacterium]|nr:hypothetical protein [Coriobacteriia bacterium]
MSRTSSSAYRIVALVLIAALCAPLPAWASVANTDIIGTVAVGDSPELAAAAPDLDIPAGVLRTFDGQVLWSRNDDAERA